MNRYKVTVNGTAYDVLVEDMGGAQAGYAPVAQPAPAAVAPVAATPQPAPAPVAAPITWKEMETIDTPAHWHVGDAAELVKRATSKALSGWGRADQTLPDL